MRGSVKGSCRGGDLGVEHRLGVLRHGVVEACVRIEPLVCSPESAPPSTASPSSAASHASWAPVAAASPPVSAAASAAWAWVGERLSGQASRMERGQDTTVVRNKATRGQGKEKEEGTDCIKREWKSGLGSPPWPYRPPFPVGDGRSLLPLEPVPLPALSPPTAPFPSPLLPAFPSPLWPFMPF